MRNACINKFLLLFSGICIGTLTACSQHFSISINDNMGSQYNGASYRITNDSLVINGVSDFGQAHVNYLNRKLNKVEKINLQHFVKSFPADSLKEIYFNDYSNFEYISADNFPRVLEVEIVKGNKKNKSKATNAYVAAYAGLFDELNPLLPAEVQFKYDRKKFNAFY